MISDKCVFRRTWVHFSFELLLDANWLLVLDEQIKRIIREAYFNNSNFFDEDIFRHARQCNLIKNIAREQSWLARLFKSKRRDVLQLQRLAIKNAQMQEFQNALNNLLLFIDFWSTLKIKTFHRVLTFRYSKKIT